MLFNDQKTEPAHILIIDDQPSNVLILREAVRDLGEIHFATSGEAALRAAQREPPDIILLDIEMPEMDGYTFTAEIRNNPNLKDLHVILHTSLSGVFNQAMVQKVGANNFIAKFQPDELAKAVQGAL